jgi:hypothetical protein
MGLKIKLLSVLLAVCLVGVYAPATAWAGDGDVCEIGGKGYATLDLALAAVQNEQTIKLLQDIDYTDGIEIMNKDITFDVNGYTLDLVNTAGYGLRVDDGIVDLTDTSPGGGEFNVTGSTFGVVALYGTASVTNATATGPGGYGAIALDGGDIEISGNVQGVTVGASAQDAGSSIYIGGGVTAGAGIGAAAADQGTVTVDGGISAATYIRIGAVSKAQGEHTGTEGGYFVYTDQASSGSTVRVKNTTPPSGGDVCEIGGTGYATLDLALAAVQDGESATIKLLQDIDYTGGIEIVNKDITFDLNGYTLDVVNTAGIGLRVDTGSVDLTDTSPGGDGEFNVTGTTNGVYVVRGEATVSGATATTGTGAFAVGSSAAIVITDDVQGETNGVCAGGSGSSVTVSGNVQSDQTGAHVYDGGTVTVNGQMTAEVFYVIAGSATEPVYLSESDYQLDLANPGYYLYTGSGAEKAWVKIPILADIPHDGNSGITNQTQGAHGSRQVTLTVTVQNEAGDPLTGIGPEYFEVTINGEHQWFDTSSLLSGFTDNGDGTYTVVFTGAADSAGYPFMYLKVKGVIIEYGPTAVTTPGPTDDYVCEIVGGDQHNTLDEALDAAFSGDIIRLLQDIDYEGGLVINSKIITLDVNGYTLNVVNDETGGNGLVVENHGSVDLADTSAEGGGEFNVTGKTYGVKADLSSVTVTSVTATGPGSIGIFANNSSSVNTESVRGVQFAAYACADSFIEVEGDVTAVASNGKGVYADDKSEICVSGNVTATGGAASIGAHAIRSSAITVDGIITATTYIKIGDVPVLQEDYTGIDGSYYVYTDAASPGNTVRVRIPPPAIITESLPNGKAGIAYSHAVTATGGGPIAFSLLNGSLPGGLSLDPVTGFISGTPDSTATFTFTVRAENSAGVFDKEFTITITAASSGGGSGSSPLTPATPTYHADVKAENNAATTIPVAVNKDTRTAFIDAGSQNLTQNRTVVTVPSIPDVDTYTFGIPVPDLSTAVEHGTLTLNTDTGSVTVPSNMLTGVAGVSGSKADITIGQGDKNALSDHVKALIGDKPLISLTLSIDGKQTDWSNPVAPVTVSIPYAPTAAELANPESIVVWYIDGSGNVVTIPNGRYDAATGTVSFFTTHFSDYAVAYNKVNFKDVASGAWYADAVFFIAAREITGGTGDGTTYSPEAKLTRGEFIVMMMRAYGIAPDANPTDNFSDAGNTYYTGYLAAAKRLGITAGVGNNMYAPGKEITRQEMFTLLYNALKVIVQLPQGDPGKTLSDFTDAGQIDPWAKEAMKLLVESGTVSGSNGKLTPTGTTTRAEMAQVLYNLLGI